MSRHRRTSSKHRRLRAARQARHDSPEVGGDRRAALLIGCYRAAAEYSDASLALLALKLRQFSGVSGGGNVSFQAEGACLAGVCGRLAGLAQQVSTAALEAPGGGTRLLENDSLTSHRLATLVRDALLAVGEIEALRAVYRKSKPVGTTA
jgi:hypothetical protein